MRDQRESKVAEYSPDRNEIKAVGTKDSSVENDTKIKAEAERRFVKTMYHLNVGLNLWNKVPEKERIYQESEEGEVEILPDTFRENELLTKQPILGFIEKATALRIYANQQIDEYRATKVDFRTNKDDPILQVIEADYQKTVKELYEEATNFGIKEKREALKIKLGLGGLTPPEEDGLDQQEAERWERYYDLEVEINEASFLHGLDADVLKEVSPEEMVTISTQIADACSTNSYLEELFQVFASRSEKLRVSVLYREKCLRIAKEHHLLEIPTDQLKEREAAFRDHLSKIYDITESGIPQVLYINREKAEEWEELILGREVKGALGFYLDKTRHEEIDLALGLTCVYLEPEAMTIDQAEILFEELYHSSRYGFPLEAKKKWGKMGDFFEEGLAKYEVRQYFEKTTEVGNLVAVNTRRWKAKQGRLGNLKYRDSQTLNHSAGRLLEGIVKKVGGEELIPWLRLARSGDEEVVDTIKNLIDQRCGQGMFEELCRTRGYESNKHKLLYNRLKLERIVNNQT